ALLRIEPVTSGLQSRVATSAGARHRADGPVSFAVPGKEGRGIAFVDAPLLGTKKPADDGQLFVLASGPAEVEDRLPPGLRTSSYRSCVRPCANSFGRSCLAMVTR